jgi:hypothetical protein
MKKKLTLTIEAGAIRRLKSLAGRRKTSVSALLEQWSERAQQAPASGPLLGGRLRGRWTSHRAPTDPRLDFLLRKHAT